MYSLPVQKYSVDLLYIRLHKEIRDFYEYVKPRPFEEFIRGKLVEDLQERVSNGFRGASVRTFGSFPAGLYLPTADMDLVCVSDSYMDGGYKEFGQSNRDVRQFGRWLEKQGKPQDRSVELILGARVPLVKYVDRVTGLKVDISFENDTGLVANKTFQDWKAKYPAMPIIVTLVKHLLAMRGLNEPVNGGIGGFSVICLVVSLFQHMPQVRSGNMIPEHHLGEILMEFLDLYGNRFNWITTAIQFDPPAYVSKAHLGNLPYNKNPQNPKICIIDPNNPSNDISGGSSNTRVIAKCFADAHTALQKCMGDLQYSPRPDQSLLSCILSGNYTSFEQQRQHLADLHESLFGPIRE
jgi:non-canonical poly(A) RNA polymerase PAPD5/7